MPYLKNTHLGLKLLKMQNLWSPSTSYTRTMDNLLFDKKVIIPISSSSTIFLVISIQQHYQVQKIVWLWPGISTGISGATRNELAKMFACLQGCVISIKFPSCGYMFRVHKQIHSLLILFRLLISSPSKYSNFSGILPIYSKQCDKWFQDAQ